MRLNGVGNAERDKKRCDRMNNVKVTASEKERGGGVVLSGNDERKIQAVISAVLYS